MSNETNKAKHAIDRRNLLLGTSTLVAAATLTSEALAQAQKAAPAGAPATPAPAGGKPNILVIWGDDIGIANISAYSNGLMGLLPVALVPAELQSGQHPGRHDGWHQAEEGAHRRNRRREGSRRIEQNHPAAAASSLIGGRH
jgi:hypothetical protein